MARHPAFEMTGGRLCLDFANTVDNRPVANRFDHLATYPDLVAWSLQARILGQGHGRALLQWAARQPRQAQQALAEACRLREAIYGTFSAVASGRPAEEELRVLNQMLPLCWANTLLVQEEGSFALGCAKDTNPARRILWAVTQSAVDLLLSEDRRNVRECASDRCAWLFVDNTKNHRRRWCDTRTCGNRDKVRRFRARQKKK